MCCNSPQHHVHFCLPHVAVSLFLGTFLPVIVSTFCCSSVLVVALKRSQCVSLTLCIALVLQSVSVEHAFTMRGLTNRNVNTKHALY